MPTFKGLDSLVEKWYIRMSQRDKEDEDKVILKVSGQLVGWLNPFFVLQIFKIAYLNM